MSPFDKAWSPYAAGILIGLLQIPAFLIIETALGASSSYVTIGAGSIVTSDIPSDCLAFGQPCRVQRSL